MTPLKVELLSSGYWHVRFGPYRFAQWPRGRECLPADVFCGLGENEELAISANKAIAETEARQENGK